MRTNRLFQLALASLLSVSAFGLCRVASANTGHSGDTTSAATKTIDPVQPLPRVADVVVQGNAPAAAPAPAAPAPAPAAAAPVQQRSTVIEHEDHNYMSTIAVSALMGGVLGVLVGGSIYFLADDQEHAGRIVYWGAGGVLVGTAVGLTQVAVQESRADRAVASRLPSDPAPTFRVALLQGSF